MYELKDLYNMEEFKNVPLPPRFLVKKGWGSLESQFGEVFVYDSSICESREYMMVETVKLLHIAQSKSLSLHFHIKKKETFYLIKGALKVTLVANGKTVDVLFKERESMLVEPGMIHAMKALYEDSILLEVSTLDRPEDSYRIIKGD